MNRATHNNLTSPIIGRCVLLVRNIVQYTAKSPNSIKHPYVDTLKADAGRLFKQAMFQLKGKDYYKRATELLEDIQAQIYLIHAVGGLSKRSTMLLDVLCDEIMEQLNSIRFGQNVKIKHND